MENNLNENVTYKKKGNIAVIILIIVVLVLIGLLSYKMFIYDKKDNNQNKDNDIVNKDDNKNNEDNNTNGNDTKTECKKNNYYVGSAATDEDKKKASKEIERKIFSRKNLGDVPIEDTFAIIVEGGDIYYYTLDNGHLYEFHKAARLDENGTPYDEPEIYTALYDNNNVEVLKEFKKTEIKGLEDIKRIKGAFYTGSDISKGLFLITDSGETYIYGVTGGSSGKFIKATFLENYKVEDVISYHRVAACIGGENIKTCGGSYNIITKDGKQYNYVVKMDGTKEEVTD